MMCDPLHMCMVRAVSSGSPLALVVSSGPRVVSRGYIQLGPRAASDVEA